MDSELLETSQRSAAGDVDDSYSLAPQIPDQQQATPQQHHAHDEPSAEAATAARTERRLRVTACLLLATAACMSAAALGVRLAESGSGNGADKAASLGGSIAWLQCACAIAAAILSSACVVLVAPRMGRRAAERLSTVALMQVLCLGLDMTIMAYPKTARMAIVACAAALRVAALAFVALLAQRAAKTSDQAVKRAERPVPSVAPQKHTLEQFLAQADDWADLQSARQQMKRKMEIGRALFGGVCTLCFILSIGNCVAEFVKVISTQTSIYPTDSLSELNNASAFTSYFGTSQLEPKRRVLFIVLDGLRLDMLEKNNELRELINDPTWAVDAKIFKMKAQLPSMSVPNWITLVTGTRPEINGVLGNLLVPETKYDSIFKQAKVFGLNRGLTGSPWFADIVSSTLPWFKGDGTVPTDAEATGDDSADGADKERYAITMYALSQKEDPYGFFLAHFSDIDVQGHCCGVSTKWNKRDTYNRAVTNKTQIIRNLTEAVDNNTIVVIASDHGQVLRGGHGGVDPSLINVPLIIYQKNSGFSKASYGYPGFRNDLAPEKAPDTSIENVDVAPTVCALMGLPVPRECEGVFVDEALSLVNQSYLALYYKDLFIQKRRLVKEFFDVVGRSGSLPNDPYPDGIPPVNHTVLSNYVLAINKIQRAYAAKRSQTIAFQQLRNLLISIVLAGFCIFAIAFLLHKASGCNVALIIPRILCWKKMGPVKPIESELMPLSPSPKLLARAGKLRKYNVTAFLASFLIVLVHFGFSISLYLCFYAIDGYEQWDSTVIHTSEVVPKYFVAVLLPSFFSAGVITWAYHMAHSTVKIEYADLKTMIVAMAKRAVSGWGKMDMLKIYLYRHYVLLWLYVATMILFIIQGSYTFLVPDIFRMHFVTHQNWMLRFRLITVQIIAAPLMIVTLSVLFALPRITEKRPAILDPVFLLQVLKEKDFWGPNKPGSGNDSAQQPARTYQRLFLSQYAKPLSFVGKFRSLVKTLLEEQEANDIPVGAALKALE